MSSKESLVGHAKKTFLKYKVEKRKKQIEFESFLVSQLAKENFHFLDADNIQALQIQASEKKINNALLNRDSDTKEVDFSAGDSDLLKSIGLSLTGQPFGWIYCFPSEWYLCGGMLIDFTEFMSNFNSISYYLNDDFDIYTSDLSSSLCFRSDRTGDILSYASVIANGGDFVNFLTTLEANG